MIRLGKVSNAFYIVLKYLFVLWWRWVYVGVSTQRSLGGEQTPFLQARCLSIECCWCSCPTHTRFYCAFAVLLSLRCFFKTKHHEWTIAACRDFRYLAFPFLKHRTMLPRMIPVPIFIVFSILGDRFTPTRYLFASI